MANWNGSILSGQSYNYTPFGETYNGSGPGNNNEQGYTGHIEDKTGLTYMQARYYDPLIGRFLQTDPIGYYDQMNLYAYVGNDPGNARDPSGKSTLCNGPCNFNGTHPKLTGRQLASLTADFTPVVGDIKGGIEFLQEPTVLGGVAVVVGIAPIVGDLLGKGLKQLDNVVISMDEAVDMGSDFVDGIGDMIETGSGNNFQFINHTTDGTGQTTTNIARFDVNPGDAHVNSQGAHLNLETHVDGQPVSNQHIPIDPETVRPGDHP